MKYIKLIIAVLITGIAIYIYSGFFGNPIEYLKVKHAFEDYIDKNYDGKLEIEAIKFNFKTGGFYAQVGDGNYNTNSYLDYYYDGSIGDGYYQDTITNMQDEINNYISYNIEKETGIKRHYMILEPTINFKQYKYKVNDFYSGEEPIDLTLELGYTYDKKKKSTNKSEKDKFPYKNKDEFIKDTYKIVKSLKKINYDFSNVTIYSFKEDGNNAYEVNIKNLNDIKSENDLEKIVKNIDYSKTE